MLHRSLDCLTEPMRKRVSELIAKCEAEGIHLFVYETLRDANVQAAYFAQGRETLSIVNGLREKAGLWKITEAANQTQITDSKNTVYNGVGHGNGTAADVVPMKGETLLWNAPMAIWEQIGFIAESVGLVWGGRWKSWDGPHVQMPRG